MNIKTIIKEEILRVLKEARTEQEEEQRIKLKHFSKAVNNKEIEEKNDDFKVVTKYSFNKETNERFVEGAFIDLGHLFSFKVTYDSGTYNLEGDGISIQGSDPMSLIKDALRQEIQQDPKKDKFVWDSAKLIALTTHKPKVTYGSGSEEEYEPDAFDDSRNEKWKNRSIDRQHEKTYGLSRR